MARGRIALEQRAKEINEYREKFPNASRDKIRYANGTTTTRLKELVDAGLIAPLPAPLKRGTHSNWTSHFKVKTKESDNE